MTSAHEGAGEKIRQALNRKDLASARQRAALARLLALTDTDVLAIQHLAQAGRLTPSQLGSLLRITSGGATALVQRLEREGCVRREPHPTDRRSTLLRLTPQIERAAGEALGPLVRDIEALATALAPEERELIAGFLLSVTDAAERHATQLGREADASAAPEIGSPVPGLWA